MLKGFTSEPCWSLVEGSQCSIEGLCLPVFKASFALLLSVPLDGRLRWPGVPAISTPPAGSRQFGETLGTLKPWP